MKNIINLLKGKSYEEGLKIVERELGKSNEDSWCKNGMCDMYIYKEDIDNWVCFTCQINEVKDDEPQLCLSQGYWSICIEGEVTTEKSELEE